MSERRDSLRRREPSGPLSSEALHRALFDRSKVAIVLVQRGRIIEASQAAARLLGWPHPLELVGLELGSLTTPADEAVLSRWLESAPGENSQIVVEFDRPVAAPSRVELTATPLGPDGDQAYLLHCKEINNGSSSELAWLRAKLEEREQRLQTLVEASLDAIAVHQQGRVVFVNPAGAALLGASSPEELLGRPTLEFVHPDSRPAIERRLAHLETEPSKQPLLQQRLVGLDGVTREAEARSIGIRYRGSPATLVLGRELRPPRLGEATGQIAFQAHLLETVGQAAIATDTEGRVIYWNRGAETLIGWQKSEALGRDVLEMVSAPPMRARGQEVLERLRAGESVTVEVDLQRRDGSSFPALLNAAPSLEEDRVAALIFTAVDLTAQRESAASEAFLRQRLQSLWTVASMVDAELTELYDRVMQELLTMTGGQFAFFGVLDAAEQAVTVVAYSEGVLELCGAAYANRVFPIEGAGVWAEAIARRASVVLNDSKAIGATPPPGHVPMHNLLAVPVMAHGRVVALAAMINKPGGFTSEDAAQVEGFVNSVNLLLEKRRAEDRYRTFFERIQSAVVVFETPDDGASFLIKDFNAATAELSGLDHEQVIGREVGEVFAGAREIGLHQSLRQVWRSGESKELRARHYQDERLSFHLDIWLFRLPTREVVGVAEDVSALVQDRQRLEREVRVNAALAEMGHALISVDNGPNELNGLAQLVLASAKLLTGSEHGYVSTIDPETGDNVGRTLTAMMGDQCRLEGDDQRIVFSCDADRHYGGLWGHALSTQRPHFTNHPDSHPAARGLPEGHLPLHSFLSVPVLFGEELLGQIALANADSYDERDLRAISQLAELYALALDRHRNQQERSRLEESLLRSQKMEAMGTLARGIAHDFNNILTIITGFACLAEDDVADRPEVVESLRNVNDAVDRARDLVQQILTFSRPGHQRRRRVVLSEIVQEAARLLRGSLPSTIELDLDIVDNSPVVFADPSQVHQVLMNLCTNAYHAMRGQAESPARAERRCRLGINLDSIFHPGRGLGLEQGRYARLVVSDTGHGMTDAVRARIFEPYFSTKSKSEGTGLGLAMVHSIVTAHDGNIHVDSTPGEGTRFEILLPCSTEEEGGATEARRETPPPPRAAQVLVVDDERMILTFYARALPRLGYEVTTCASGSEALATVQAHPDRFDVVVTDQTMPYMTGLELGQQLRELRPNLPLVLCTGLGESTIADDADALGFTAFLEKPIDAQRISSVLERVIKR